MTSFKTIHDFGTQWQLFTQNEGFYGSVDLLQEILGDALSVKSLHDAKIADIGSGTGRIVQMLLASGASHVTALEPSSAYEVLKKNLEPFKNQVTCLQRTGEHIPQDTPFDHVISLGVLHHVPDPQPIVKACYHALQPGGKMTIWVYGREGNELYLFFVRPLRCLTTHLPPKALLSLSWIFYPFLWAYAQLCRAFPLPMKNYMTGHILKLTRQNRILTIYDQLNPAYAKYYTRQEAMNLIQQAGFTDLKIYHRHGYGWTVSGKKPGNNPEGV